MVEFCVKYGTHYADITGEVAWNKEMMKLYESSARRSGSKVVSFCGHDSIPWDLSVRFLSDTLRVECNDELVSVECLNELKGDVSGGTLATVYDSLDRAIKDFQWESLSAKNTLDVYCRLPNGSESPNRVNSDLPAIVSACRNPAARFSNRWCGPFIMSAINLEIVRRSITFSSCSNLTVNYREAVVSENFKEAFTLWFGLVLLGTLIINPITRPLVKNILPQPGEGPSERMRMEGFLCVTGYGIGAKGSEVETAIYFPRDGGYHSTARMLVESGICLALDENRHDFSEGGFYSPASIMCDALLDRLVKTGTCFACRVNAK